MFLSFFYFDAKLSFIGAITLYKLAEKGISLSGTFCARKRKMAILLMISRFVTFHADFW